MKILYDYMIFILQHVSYLYVVFQQWLQDWNFWYKEDPKKWSSKIFEDIRRSHGFDSCHMYRLEFTGDGRQPPDHKEMEPWVVEQVD